MPSIVNTYHHLARLAVLTLVLGACGGAVDLDRPPLPSELGRLEGPGAVVVFGSPASDRAIAQVPAGLEARLIGERRAGRVPIQVGGALVLRGWVSSDRFARYEVGERPVRVADLERATRALRPYARGPVASLPAGTELRREGALVAHLERDAYAVVVSCRGPVEVVAVGEEGIVVAGEAPADPSLRAACERDHGLDGAAVSAR